MNMIGTIHRLATVPAALVLLASAALLGGAAHAEEDVLYVGDVGAQQDTTDDTIKRFDVRTGEYLGVLIPPPRNPPLIGPTGLIVRGQILYVANQNTFQPFPGDIRLYKRVRGRIVEEDVVPAQILGKNNHDAPFAPRGMVLWSDSNLLVASAASNNSGSPGEVLKYTLAGQLVAALAHPEFAHPRGVVIGPDHQLYVSNVQNFPAGNGGQVLRFDPASGRLLDVFISNDVGPQGDLRSPKGDCNDNLNRPEGLVFGPDGNLYIASFRAGVGDVDRILIFAGPTSRHARPGTCLGSIELDKFPTQAVPNPPRSFAQALLFGPGGVLFVPIANLTLDPNVVDSGAIRRYQVVGTTSPMRLPDFVPPHDANFLPLRAPIYLTFGKTDPGTLAYGG